VEPTAMPPDRGEATAVPVPGTYHNGVRLFAEVTAAELPAVFLLASNGFLMMTAYYILKTVREPLILLGSGARIPGVELKTYATAVQALLLLGLVPAYGHLASRVNRLRLIRTTVSLLVVSLLLFAALSWWQVDIGVPYYLWLGIAGLIGVAQFWSFANDYYTRTQGERVFPLIAVGGSLGAILGSGLARWLLPRAGLIQLMLVAAGVLVLYTGIFSLVERLDQPARAAANARRPVDGRGGFELVIKSRYLFLIGVMVMVANLVNTQGEYLFARAINAQAEALVPAPAAPESLSPETTRELRDARRAVVGKLYGEFYGGVNVLGLLLQMVLVARIFKRLGVHGALFVFPMIALFAYGSMAAAPVFVLIAAAKTVENGADYSVHNTVRHALFLPTGRDAKYKAKAVIDSFFLRSGDLVAGATVFAGIHLLGLDVRWFALSNVALILVWLVIVAFLSRSYRGLAKSDPATAQEPT
jgi:AAA family ATP:ADP antiporter